MSLVDEEAVREALRAVMDPEAGMNIVDLGLVVGVQCAEQRVAVQMTMTSAACPVAEMLLEEARQAIAGALPPGIAVDVELVWDPPWTPELMSGLARDQFGWAPR